MLRLAGVSVGALLVVPMGLADGGYFGRGWTALSVALASIAILTVVQTGVPRLGRAALLVLAVIGSLTVWIGLSGAWAPAGADTLFETRRALLYAIALVTVLVVASRSGPRAVLLGLALGISVVGAVAVALRAVNGIAEDGLLQEPIGYPNALGVLAALGWTLAVGLGCAPGVSPLVAGALRAVAPLLVLVLGLSGSRGAALTLLAGAVALVALAGRPHRATIGSLAVTTLVVGSLAWFPADRGELDGASLAAAALLASAAGITVGRRTWRLPRRALAVIAAVVVVGLVVTLVSRPGYATSSFRTAYWEAAFDEVPSHLLHGTGAGSFFLTWAEHRDVVTAVRDAHSVYIEALSELGIVGIVLIVLLVATPLVVAWRRRGDTIAATAGASFLVFALHAGLDWDWEMPVVGLVGLACAATLLAESEGD